MVLSENHGNTLESHELSLMFPIKIVTSWASPIFPPSGPQTGKNEPIDDPLSRSLFLDCWGKVEKCRKSLFLYVIIKNRQTYHAGSTMNMYS